jgi:Leucine-rich repeat (LRR) protein
MATTLENAEKIREEVKKSQFTCVINLSFCSIKSFPQSIMESKSLLQIKKLDLSHNCITCIPSSLSTLVGLKELWLQHNPLTALPDSLHNIANLELIDISHTLVSELTTEMANLTKLYEFDWRSTPLELNLKKYDIDTNDVLSLRKRLGSLNTRKKLEEQLTEYLSGEKYIQEADNPKIDTLISLLVEVFT